MTPSNATTREHAVDLTQQEPGRPATSWASAPLRGLLVRLLCNLSCGALQVELPGGLRAVGRGTRPGPHATLVLHRWRPMLRLLLRGDIGFAQSFRDGDWSTPDLTALLELGIRNEAGWNRALEGSWPVRLRHRLGHLRRANTRRGSRRNIAFHYDMGNAFYAQWLDPDLIYSSALYAHQHQSLEDAQAHKLQRIRELLDVRPGDAVLEIGCGWGALALAMAHGGASRVTGVTLSTEQLAHAQRRLAQEGLAGQVDLRLQDYRDVPGHFERIVSIEMMEAVGERYWPTYFDTLAARLAPGGKAVLQVITMADTHFERYRRNADFIQHYIFPGGMLPSVGAMQAQAQRAGLTLRRDESFGLSYAATLAEWRARFHRAWPQIKKLGFDAAFRRLWDYYLCYCEAGFRSGRVDVGLFTLTHQPQAGAAG